MAIEIIRIFGNAVGHVMLHPVPYEFGRIEFRGIPGEKIRMNTGMAFKESFDRPGFVHNTSIPQNHKPSFQMPEKIPQKSQDLGMPDVFQGVKTNIQGNPAFTRRNTDRGDSGYLRPSTGDFKNRGLSDRSPSLSDARDKAKSALVEEDKRDVKPFGLFLYAAKYGASTVLSPFHPVAGLLFQASDDSNAILAESSRRDPDDKSRRSDYRSLWPLFPGSTSQSSNRFSKDLPQAFVSKPASGARLVSQVYPAPVSISRRSHLSSGADHSSNKPNLTNNRVSGLFPADSFLYPRAPRPAADAFQALFGFHGGAWNQFTIFLLLMRESIVHDLFIFACKRPAIVRDAWSSYLKNVCALIFAIICFCHIDYLPEAMSLRVHLPNVFQSYHHPGS